MSYGTGPAPYGGQAPYGDQPAYGGPAPYPGGATPYGAPNQFGQFGPPPLTPDIAPQPGASFGEAVKRFFQRYAQFSGYASQSEFWWPFLLLQIVIPSSLYMLVAIISIPSALTPVPDTPAAVYVILGLLLFYEIVLITPALAVTARRLHDTGKSELFLLFYFIGLGIIPLIMCCMRSRPDLYRPEWG